jgi:hypothetical protein
MISNVHMCIPFVAWGPSGLTVGFLALLSEILGLRKAMSLQMFPCSFFNQNLMQSQNSVNLWNARILPWFQDHIKLLRIIYIVTLLEINNPLLFLLVSWKLYPLPEHTELERSKDHNQKH